MGEISKEVLETITYSIVTVPGVAGFAQYDNSHEKFILNTNDIKKAIDVTNFHDEKKIKIHLVLIHGVNIRDVINEVQIRVKYELEKLSNFSQNYEVDITVDDLITN